VLLRDCTLANDLPDEQAELLGTQRMVTLLESLYCVSVTSQEFVEAARQYAREQQAAQAEGAG
jgi:hypothetical protein